MRWEYAIFDKIRKTARAAGTSWDPRHQRIMLRGWKSVRLTQCQHEYRGKLFCLEDSDLLQTFTKTILDHYCEATRANTGKADADGKNNDSSYPPPLAVHVQYPDTEPILIDDRDIWEEWQEVSITNQGNGFDDDDDDPEMDEE